MKKIVLATAATLALSTSVMAFNLVDENENVVIGAAFDVEGSDNNSKVGTPQWAGNPSAGRYGTDKDAAYEISVSIEETVEDFDFGTRKTLTIYNHGDTEMFDGGYSKKATNYGADLTYSVYYKITKYFKPYIGAGLGVNRNTFDGEGTDLTSKTSYKPTLNGVVGASGNVIAGIGYYAEYKYRLADNFKNQLFIVEDSSGHPQATRFDVDGVNGGQFMLGLNYKF